MGRFHGQASGQVYGEQASEEDYAGASTHLQETGAQDIARHYVWWIGSGTC